MIQAQFINYLISSGDSSLITVHNLTVKYFSEYKNEFLFIKAHLDRYGNIPDAETFVASFPDFELIEVKETHSYLVSELFKDYQTRNIAETFNKVRKLFKQNYIFH